MGKLGNAAKKVWNFLDGWKTFIVAIVATYKLMCHDCAGAGYANAIVSALGWDAVTGAFDPAQAAMALGFAIAIGHRLLKAVRQYRTGVPMEYVGTNTGAVIEVQKTAEERWFVPRTPLEPRD